MFIRFRVIYTTHHLLCGDNTGHAPYRIHVSQHAGTGQCHADSTEPFYYQLRNFFVVILCICIELQQFLIYMYIELYMWFFFRM